MDNNHTYPVLGEPILVGGKVYRIKEKAIKGETYTIICPKCGNHLSTTPAQAKANIEKCPECKAIFGYNAKEVAKEEQQQEQKTAQGEKTDNEERQTVRVVSPNALKKPGVLEWGNFLFKRTVPLHLGMNTIGRKDDSVPSEISFKDEYMSRRSVAIDVQKDPNRSGYKFKLTVLRAANPVIVGSSQLLVGNSIYLNYGDTITLGNTVITFKEGKS